MFHTRCEARPAAGDKRTRAPHEEVLGRGGSGSRWFLKHDQIGVPNFCRVVHVLRHSSDLDVINKSEPTIHLERQVVGQREAILSLPSTVIRKTLVNSVQAVGYIEHSV